MQRRQAVGTLLLGALGAGGRLASAQEYPAKPIRLVVPFAAGGPADIQARWLAVKMSAVLGQQVIVDNRGGAGGIVGAQAVASASPDGYTLLFASVGAIAVAPFLAGNLAYDPAKDLAPVVRVSTAPTVLVTGAGSRFKTLADLIRVARAESGRVSFASAGPGTTTHLGSELLAREAGVKMVHVPYRGAAPAITDVIAGTADVIFADAPVVLPFLKSGKMRALAIGTPARVTILPDVPTTTEAGYPNALVSTWYGLLATGRTPAAVIARLNAAINALLVGAEAKAYFGDQATQINGGTPAEFTAFIRSESERWPALARSVGVKLD